MLDAPGVMSATAGKSGREVAARTPRTMARATASAAASPSRVTSAATSPTDSAKSVSPSKAVCGGDSALANPSIPSDATLPPPTW